MSNGIALVGCRRNGTFLSNLKLFLIANNHLSSLTQSPPEADDGVILAAPYCAADDPLWNSSVSWHTNSPDFTPCFEMTFLAGVPCAFLLVAFPFHFSHLRATNRGVIPRSFLHVGKLVALILMLFLTLMDFASTLWANSHEDRHFAPVYIITPVLLHVCLCLAGKRRKNFLAGSMGFLDFVGRNF